MLSLRFDKNTVLSTLRKNKEKHIEIVKEAQKGYREKAIQLLEEKLEQLKSGKEVDPYVVLQVPQNLVDEYNNAIEMLEMSDEKLVVLDANTFSCYMKDRWGWRGSFLLANSAYSGTARELSNSERDPDMGEIMGS